MLFSKSTGGFYDLVIHGDNIPADAVEITEVEHANLLYAQSQGKRIDADVNGKPIAVDPIQTLDDVKAQQIAKINASCNEFMSTIVAQYPPLEMQTWPNQLSEANAYQANANASTPTLSAIAMASGQTVAALAASVISKASAYTAAAGAAIGKRQALTAQIIAEQAASNSQNDVDVAKAAVKAVVW